MPEGVYQTYEDAIQRVRNQSEDDAQLATKVLSYVFLAKRLLTVDEMIHAVAVELGDTALDDSAISEIEILLSITAGLVTVDEKSKTVRLVHYTLQEYLEKSHERLFPNAKVELTKACLTYLSFDTFKSGPCAWSALVMTRLQNFHFFVYASFNWGHHARENQQSELLDIIMRYLRDEKKMLCSFQIMYAAYDEIHPHKP